MMPPISAIFFKIQIYKLKAKKIFMKGFTFFSEINSLAEDFLLDFIIVDILGPPIIIDPIFYQAS